MSDGHRARDLELLDAIDALPREAFENSAWRAVRNGRDPLLASRPAGRWDTGGFDVLDTSLDRSGALAEIHYHLSRQPVFPSTVRWKLHKLAVKVEKTLHLANVAALGRLGVEAASYPELDYSRTQAIADGAYFLGFDGLIAPSARAECLNLVIFADRIDPAELSIQATEDIDWLEWRRSRSKA
jgi:RES domain-containing protein